MDRTIITCKAALEGQPFSISIHEYLSLMENQTEAIYDGAFGIHLAPKILVNNTPYFFPILEIHGDSNPNFNERIGGAIFHTSKALKTLGNFGAERLFKIIATGNGGFQLISRKALPMDYHRAFQMFVRRELPMIQNAELVDQVDAPLPLLTTFGHRDQVQGGACTRHSEPLDLPWHGFKPESYLEKTLGNPDPDTAVTFIKWLLQVEPVTDISTLDKFGERLDHFKSILSSNQIIPFQAAKMKRAAKPLTLQELHAELTAKGIPSKIERRGAAACISFDKLPCPSCGRPDVRAWAFPPYYRLRCFNAKCKASQRDGIPLIQWAGIVNDYEKRSSALSEMAYVAPPKDHLSLDEARAHIRNELSTNENVLFLVTPGVGKSHETLKYLATQCTGKTVLYSCLNRGLKDEAYRKCLEFASSPSLIHNFQPREDLCLNKGNLQKVTEAGYSPAALLCISCNEKSQCQYHQQRTRITHGIYFVTHPMLEYLEHLIPEPDLIILDENLLRGFVADETASESDMRTLLKVLKGAESEFVENLLQAASRFAAQATTSQNAYSQIINGRRISRSDFSEDTILECYARHCNLSREQVEQSLDAVRLALSMHDGKRLHQRGVNFKAVQWINGLSKAYPTLFSYLEATPKGGVFFKTKRIKRLGFGASPVKILDATGHPKLAETMTGRKFQTVRADVPWESNRIQIKQKLSRTNLASMSDSGLKKIINLSLEKITAAKVLILTHKTINGAEFISKIKQLCESQFPEKQFMAHHFFGPRGINDFQGCEAIFILGMPIPNVNSTWQEASILFSKPEDEEIRDTWIDLSTNWELIQCLHRVRPVNNQRTELVIANDNWPPSLTKPNETIDESRDQDKIEKAVERLKPFLREFGFMNRDLAMIAGVYQHRQENIFHEIHCHLWIINMVLSVFGSRIYFESPKLFSLINLSQKVRLSTLYLLKTFLIGKVQLNDHFRSISINTIMLFRRLIKSVELKNTQNDTIVLNYNQFKGALEKLYADQKQLIPFSVKSSYGRGHTINGIGIKSSIYEFYNSLNESSIFKNTQISSISFYGDSMDNIFTLPKSVIVVQFLESYDDMVAVAWLDNHVCVTICMLPEKISEIVSDNEKMDSKCIIITNNGKLLAKKMTEKKVFQVEIHDVNIHERILKNGATSSRYMTLSNLFRRYEKDPDCVNSSQAIYEIWKEQMNAIQNDGLAWTAELEREMIWVAAGIEADGMGVDQREIWRWMKQNRSGSPRKSAHGVLNRIGADGRFHDDIQLLGEVSARMSTKLDNIQKDGGLRSCFLAKPGCRFIIADYKQQEPRILAGLSKDKEMLGILAKYDDFYEAVGDNLVTMTDIPIQRKDVKKVVNALNYWGSVEKVFKVLRDAGYTVTMDGVRAFVDGYLANFDGVRTYQTEVIRKARKDGFVSTIMGRRRYVDDSLTSSKIINYVMQGSAADGFKNALRTLRMALDGIDARIVHTMRDAVIVEVEETSVSLVSGIVQRSMENAFREMLPGVGFPVEITASPKWV